MPRLNESNNLSNLMGPDKTEKIVVVIIDCQKLWQNKNEIENN